MIATIVEGLFAMLAAVGTVTLIWMIIGVFLRPKSCKGVYAYTLIAAGREEDVYRTLDSLLWYGDMLPEEREIIVCGDVDLDKYACDAYRRKQCESVTVLNIDTLGEYLKKQLADNSMRDTNGAGDHNPGGNS